MVEEALSLVRDRMRDKGGPLAVEVAVERDVRVEAHRHRLLQAFTNVIQNAFEAYDGLAIPGKLQIGSRPDGERRVVVTFADDGCGMSEEALRDAFQLYASKKPEGTGFGLPLAKKIIEAEHGGSVHLASQKGKGTTVTVVLPLDQEDRQE
jgi:two-component system, NtrC family, sensor kinase